MTSPLEAYLNDNPQLRGMDRERLMEQLFQTSGTDQSRRQFNEKLLADADNPVGWQVGPRKYKVGNEPTLPDPMPELSEVPWAKGMPKNLATFPDVSGVEKKPEIPEAPKTPKPPSLVEREQLTENPSDAVSRMGLKVLGNVLGLPIEQAVKGAKGELTEPEKADMYFEEALGALGAVAGGPLTGRASKKAVDTLLEQQKDRLKELSAYMQAWVPHKQWIKQETQSYEKILEATSKSMDELKTSIKTAEEAYDFERAGAAKAELERVTDYWKRIAAGLPPGKDDPIMKNIAQPPKGPQSAVINKWDRYYQGLKDKYHPINKAVRLATGHFSGKHVLPADIDPYVLIRLTAGNPGRFEHVMKFGTFDPKTLDVIGPSLRDITKPVANDLPEAMRYAIAKRVVEKEGQDIATGMPLDFAKQVVSQVEDMAAYDSKYANMVTFRQEWTQFNRDMVQYLVNSGLYSQEQADTFMAKNMYYVPAYRLLPELEGGPSAKYGVTRGAQPVKAMHGSDLQWLDPLESTVQNAFAFIHVAERNRVYQALTDMAAKGDLPQIAERVRVEARPINLADDEIKSLLRNHGIDASGEEAMTIFRARAGLAENEIAVYRDGKREIWRADPAIISALSYMDSSGMSDLKRLVPPFLAHTLRYPAAMLRAGATRSPDFPFANVWRDQFTAVMNTKYGYQPGDMLRGLEDLVWGEPGAFKKWSKGSDDIKWGGREGFKEWLRGGGANATLVNIDEMRSEMARLGVVPNTAADIAKFWATSPLRGLEIWSNMYEYATRIGGYLNAKSEGASIRASAYEARELTVDFARNGAQMRAYNLIVAFQNAQMEGPDRMVRAFVSNPVRATTAAIGGNFLPALLLWQANHDDPRYKNLPDYERHSQFIFLETNWKQIPEEIANQDWVAFTGDEKQREEEAKLYPMRQIEGKWQINKGSLASYYNSYRIRPKTDDPNGPWEANMGRVFKLPMAWEIGTTFAALPIAALNKYVAGNPRASEGVLNALIQAYTPSISPTAATPIVETMSDYSFFFGRHLTPRAVAGELPTYRFTTYTSETAKKLSAVFDRIPGLKDEGPSPIQIEHLVRGWTGALGDYSLKLSDWALRKAGVAPPDLRASWTGADMPVVRRFIARSPSYAAKPINAFYEQYIKMEQGLASWRKLQSRDKTDEADGLAAERSYTRIEPYAKALNALRKMVDATQRMPLRDKDQKTDPGLTADDKQELIQEYYRQMVLIANEGIRHMENAPKAAFTSPSRYTAAQSQARSTGDERFIIFSFLNTADQNILLQHMTAQQRSQFMPYARQGANPMGYDPEQGRIESGTAPPPKKGSIEEKQHREKLEGIMKDIGVTPEQKAPTGPATIDVKPPPPMPNLFQR